MFALPVAVFAETIKTDVLVIGSGPAGIAAAIQASRSGVKTLLVEPDSRLGGFLSDPASKNQVIESTLNAGIWAEFFRRVQESKKIKVPDSLLVYKLSINPEVNGLILKNMTDTVKNLNVRLRTGVNSVTKDGKVWLVKLANGTDVKAYSIIDATDAGKFAEGAKATYNLQLPAGQAFRTSMAGLNVQPFQLPLSVFLPEKATNIFITEPINKQIFGSEKGFNPARMMIGQTAGVLAAYVAFFKTDNTKLNVRIVQNELLTYKSLIGWYADIAPADQHKVAIQHLSVTGLLKPVMRENLPYFMPDSIVRSDEVRPVLSEIYTRTFLWFNKTKPGEKFTVGNMLSLISEFTLADPENLKRRMTSDWKNRYNFSSDYDTEKPLTRREFAVLANTFLKPFDRRVDATGKLIN